MARKSIASHTGSVLTHLSALVIGGLIFRETWSHRATSATVAADPPGWKSTSRSAAETSAQGSALLREMTKHLPAAENSGTQNASAESMRLREEHWAEMNAAADALQPAADVRAAAIDLLTAGKAEYGPEEYPEMTSRLLHWLRADPAAMIAYIYSGNTDEKTEHARYLFMQVVEAEIARSGIDAALGWMKDSPGFTADIAERLAPQIAAKGDIQQLTTLRDLTGTEWNHLSYEALKSWPVGRADDLISLATSQKQGAQMLLNYAGFKKGEGAEWLMEKLASGNLDEETSSKIGKDPQYQALLASASHLAPSVRLQEILRHDPDIAPEEARRRIVANDVMEALNSGADVRYPFRSGQLSAEQIYQDIATRLPVLAAESPEALRRQVYQELAEENPKAALAVLEGLPPAERDAAITRAPLDMFGDVDPQRFYDYLRQMPATAEEPGSQSWNTKLQAWEARSPRNLERMGNDYVNWVKGLPDGTERDMAFYGLVKSMDEDSESPTRRSLIGQITDPALVQRLQNGENTGTGGEQ